VAEVAAVETSAEISAPASAAWDILTDTSRWPEWGPSVCRVECTERYIKAGVTGRLKTAAGFWLLFRIDEFEANRSWSWSVAGIRATGHRVESTGPGSCRVIFSVPVWAAPYLLVCRVAIGRIRKILES
jgi:hypothetical protein